jgi:alginate O-acetyltransferase complex protein AlgI
VLLTEPAFLFIFLPSLIVLHVAVSAATTPDWLHGSVPLKALNWVLLIASVAYFALLSPVLAAVLVAATVFTQAIGRQVLRSEARRAWLALGIAAVASLLLTARALNALSENIIVLALPLDGRPLRDRGLIAVVLSFFALQAIAHLVNCYRRPSSIDRDPVRTGLSLLFFPFLLAGPVVKRTEMEEQLGRRMVTVANFAYGMRRFLIGLFKKLALADTIGLVADTIFRLPPRQVAAARAWLGVLCFALQIYFAVSAYSDMALGLGRMFGFRVSENFKWPYVAKSMHEFWETWFISARQWWRDVLRLPLGGGPVGAVFLAFVIAGLWYGTRPTIAMWALYHAALICAERLGVARVLRRVPGAIRLAYVWVVVLAGWVLFRSESLGDAVQYFKAMAGQNAAVASAYYLNRFLTPEVWIALLSALIGAAPLVRAIGRWRVAIDGATTAIAVMAFAVLVYIWRMGVRLATAPWDSQRSSRSAD